MPYLWTKDTSLSDYEGAAFESALCDFAIVDADIRVEESTAKGRADMILLRSGQVFIMELKISYQGRD